MYYKTAVTSYSENNTSSFRSVEDAVKRCIDEINFFNGTIVGAPLLESVNDPLLGRHGTVIIVYMVDTDDGK